MLCQFSVSNYKSIKDKITLNMEALDLSEFQTSVKEYQDGEKFLPLCAIYGPNGGGKSNLLSAFEYMVMKIIVPIKFVINNNKEKIDFSILIPKSAPYKFDDSCINKPSVFEIFFRDDMYEYHYGAAIHNDKYVNEFLSRKLIKGENYVTVFDRDRNKIKMYGTLSKVEYKDISDDLSLISYLRITHNENKIVKRVYSWFSACLDFRNHHLNYDFFPTAELNMIDQLEKHEMIVNMLKEMDIDIYDFVIKEINDEDVIITKHLVQNSIKELNLIEESKGTKKIIDLLASIIMCLGMGGTIIADELDCNLHPKLLGYILKLFSDPSINKYKAQLIFSSHDLTTMTNDYLRRDEIWFISKNSEDSSQLYSLAEIKKENGFRTRKDESYNKQYLEGRYGSDPYLKRIIEW